VTPSLFTPDLLTLEHFLDISGQPEIAIVEESIAGHICKIIELTAPEITNHSEERYFPLQTKLQEMMLSQGSILLLASAKALCSLIMHVTFDFQSIGNSMLTWYRFLINELTHPTEKARSTPRALFTLCTIIKYLDPELIPSL
jgi:hypothetical protein